MDRRLFLTGVAAMAGCATIPLIRPRVDVLEAIADTENKHGYRQRFLDQSLYDGKKPESAISVAYDFKAKHVKGLMKADSESFYGRTENSFEAIQLIFEMLSRAPQYRNVSAKTLVDKIAGLKNKADFDSTLNEAIVYSVDLKFEGMNAMTVPQNPLLPFGNKSYILFYDPAFDRFHNPSFRNAAPSDFVAVLKSTGLHEKVHADDFRGSIKEAGFAINNSNFLDFNKYVLSLFIEVRAYLAELQHAQGNSYVISTVHEHLASNIRSLDLGKKKLSDLDEKLLEHIDARLQKEVPEVVEMIKGKI